MILFTAGFCQQCPSVKKYIKDNGLEGKVEIIDIGDQPEVARQHRIRGLPSLLDKDILIVGAEKIINHLKEGV